ncbi:MAG: alanine--tRNA ligase [Candidatus Veblenbacteria bacterium]|nr:alanine--tRNA ligase [Candidatus Veblenbacteria bacterium]
MTALELRQKFLDFFKSKGHTVIPSASLVPMNDPTVLFTTAGMHPLVPYLLGEPHPGGKRLTSAQKCIRTGDIDEVGDDVHLTFFEMLGNWSLGDYFKDEAISWSFEFMTDKKWLGLPVERLAVSCFAGDSDAPKDEESAKLWRACGISQERIAFLGKEDNWWGPAGQTGPCGPDTEMFYWVDAGTSAPDNFQATHDDPRWVEIWNDVFMQYNKTATGTYEPLQKKNVDTGMGLDRTLAVLKGQRSFYDTELFKPMFDVIGLSQEVMTGDEARKARVVVDHIRATTFMVGDGVEPSNKDRGYVLRRLLRRAMVYAKLLGLRPHWLKALVGQVIQIYSQAYPELVERSEEVFKVIEAEENKFGSTLEKGLRQFRALVEGGETITGHEAFDLYQSYGFPFELTQELSEQSGQAFDEAKRKQFAAEFKKHQDLSRTASAGTFKGGLADHTEEVIRLHTATHLMNAALRKVLGEHVWQKGSNITKERTRFDFTHPEKMTEEQKAKVEELVNGWIARDLMVKREVIPLEEARQLSAIGVFGEKYAETVSVYTVLDPTTNEVISREFCGGPHVEHTGQIGKFRILKEEAVAAGVRRIKAAVA